MKTSVTISSVCILTITVLIFDTASGVLIADPIGIWESGGVASAVQSSIGTPGQNVVGTTITQSPFSTDLNAQLGAAFVTTHLTATVNGHVIVLAIETLHHCERTLEVKPVCYTTADFYLTPTVDVQLSVTGSYHYHLLGDPTRFNYGYTVNRRIGSDFQYMFGQGYAIDSFFNPSDANLSLNSSGILPAGGRYRISVEAKSEADLAGNQIGPTVSGSGNFLVEVAPVPEPATVGLLAIALLTRRWGAGRASGLSPDR